MKSIHIFLLTVILIIGIPQISDAQIEPYSKVLMNTGTNGIQALATCQNYEFETIIVGEIHNDQAFIAKINNEGNPVWAKSLQQVNDDHTFRLSNIINTKDSCQLILGKVNNENNDNQDALLAKINKNGDLLWTKTNSLGKLINLSETADSGFILIGSNEFSSTAYTQLSVVKVTKNGSLEWSRTIRFGTSISQGLSIIQKENGNYLFCGKYRNENETKTTALMGEISNTGELNWAYGYQDPEISFHHVAEDILIINDEYHILMNNGMNSIILKTDTLGNFLNAVKFPNITFDDMGYGIKRKLYINNQNELIFIHTSEFPFGGFVKKNLNNETYLNGNVFLPIIDIQVKEQGELLAIGNGPILLVKDELLNPFFTVGLVQMNFEGNGSDCILEAYEDDTQEIFLQQIETDYIIEGGGISTNLNIEMESIEIDQRDGCIDVIGSVENLQEKIISVFPNPSQGYINFDIEENFDGYISIINPLGQIIHQEKINQQQLKIDLNRFGNGVYLYRIESDKALISSGCFILNN